MRKYIRQNQQAKEKAANRERLSLEAQLPLSELIAGVRDDIEAFAAELGLTIIQRVMEAVDHFFQGNDGWLDNLASAAPDSY